jgi:aldehyde dehydrogenase (NAD+)
MSMRDFLTDLGLTDTLEGASAGGFFKTGGDWLESRAPADGSVIAKIRQATVADYERVVTKAQEVFERFRMLPAPKRGDMVREMGLKLRDKKKSLGQLVSLEMGKIRAEGEGEVQEMIDIADYAVGLSRQLYGLVIASERPMHRMSEQWHPLGVVGIISAFNFPVAVWSWNAFIAAVCGDTMVWKPSHKTPLCGIAVQRLMDDVLAQHGFGGAMGLVVGPTETVGEAMVKDPRLPLISATGSSRMGKRVGEVVAGRIGKCLLELGGNNALVVHDDANLDLALRAVVFGAVGTAGQRCTSTRRLLVHASVADAFVAKLVQAYKQVPIGDPLAEGTLMGPLIDTDAVEAYSRALERVRAEGGEVVCGGRVLSGGKYASGTFVEPTIVRAKPGMPIVAEETFAPILYVMTFDTVEEAIALQNDVPQGLSSAIFTESMRVAERFLSAAGSDCGIANVNIGTSGAEIGGAFGGEKETGGGREAGSDSWKAYMRRQTQTINWSTELPLAQGIKFQ